MARRLTLVALLVGSAGFVLQMVAGVTDTPTIPPGLVALLAAALAIALTSSRGAVLVGMAAAAFNLVVFIIVGVGRLFDVTPVGGFVGAWLMFVGLIASCAFGAQHVRSPDVAATGPASESRRADGVSSTAP